MKRTSIIFMFFIGLATNLEARETIIKCAAENPLKLVSNFFRSKVLEKIDGKWMPYCDDDNETLEIFDDSVACTSRHQLYVGRLMDADEKISLSNQCDANYKIQSFHHGRLADYIEVKSLCDRQQENRFNIFDQFIAVRPVWPIKDNSWLNKTLIDFEFSSIEYFGLGPSKELKPWEFAVRPSWDRKDYLDAAGYPWEIPDTDRDYVWPCDKY